ncbi:6899_t:CDS:2, partial [Dentiscutata erythropus]
NLKEWTPQARKVNENFVDNLSTSSLFNVLKEYYMIQNGGKKYMNTIKCVISIDSQIGNPASIIDQIIPVSIEDTTSRADLVAQALNAYNFENPDKYIANTPNNIYILLLSSSNIDNNPACPSFLCDVENDLFNLHEDCNKGTCGFYERAKSLVSKEEYTIITVSICKKLIPINNCQPQDHDLNGDSHIDNMVKTLFHEIAEAITDSGQGSGWVANNGDEIGDLCQNNFFNLLTSSNGAKYNVVMNGMKYYVQSIWSLKAQKMY